MTTIQLTGKQRSVLNAAAHANNLVAWPLPKKLNLSPGSAAIVVRGLLQKGLLAKRPALGSDAIWKEEDGKRFTLVVTKAGLTACGITAVDEPQETTPINAERRPTAAISDNKRRRPRPGTKLAELVALLSRTEGATVAEMAAATGWLPHTVRGVMSGALVKKFGLRIVSGKVEGRGRVYRTEGGSASGLDEVGGTGE